jgi:hypothetical protein
LFLASHNLKALHSLSGATDLEAPEWVVDSWGSAALFEIDTTAKSSEADLEVTIPLHLRYLIPTNSTTANGSRKHPVSNPIVFWACTADSGTQFTSSPFDRKNLGYDTLFGERTMFYHVNPRGAVAIDQGSSTGSVKGGGESLVTWISAPVLDLNRTSAGVVEWGTVAVIVLGSLWVCWALVRVLIRDLKGNGKGKTLEAEKKDE